MYNYYNFIIKPILSTKLNFKNLNKTPSINYIEVSIFNKKIKNYSDFSVYKSLALLEALCLQHPILKFFYFFEKKRKVLSNITLVTLRSGFLYKFLNYFFCFLFHYFKKLNIFNNNDLVFINKFKFSIKDLSIFSFLPIFYYSWKKNIIFCLYFNNFSSFFLQKNNSILPLFLSSFNFPYFKKRHV